MKIFLLFFSLQIFADSPDAIYGKNDIKSLKMVKDKKILELSESVAVRVLKKQLIVRKNIHELKLDKLKKINEGPLCSSVDYFGKSRIVDSCSGFLIAPNLLMTALHCLEGKTEFEEDILEKGCEQFSWVFNYHDEKINSNKLKIANDDLYNCKRILEYKGSFGTVDYFDDDYVLVELDRKTDKKFLNIPKQIIEPTNVFMLGHPLGLPMKISSEGEVLERLGFFLFTNLDAFSGNSGSPVFNKETYELVGILNGGRPDFEKNGKCSTFKNYKENEGRESMYFLDNFPRRQLLK